MELLILLHPEAGLIHVFDSEAACNAYLQARGASPLGADDCDYTGEWIDSTAVSTSTDPKDYELE